MVPRCLDKARSLLAWSVFALAACQSTPVVPPSAPEASASVVVDDARGGRLYDKWYAELDLGFVPGSVGGPRGNGTLEDGRGEVMLDDGHGYRLKNLFGWDLRGADGIYGPRYQNKPYVRAVNLLADERSVEELAVWLEHGDQDLPRLGAVMSPQAIEDLAAFIVAVRTGVLPRPDQLWDLSETAPANYVLRPGADMQRGAVQITERCGCHGPTGQEITIDGEHSLGSYGRAKAYEAWFKVLNGHPGSTMGRELDLSGDGEGAVQLLDILAALCDRERYPANEGAADVGDDDPRCGAYLR